MKPSTLHVPAAWKLRADSSFWYHWVNRWLAARLMRRLMALGLLLLTIPAPAQQRGDLDLFREDGAARQAAGTSPVAAQLRQARALSLDLGALDAALAPARRGAEVVLVLPLPDGRNARFGVREASIMDAPTAARFPELRTYAGRGLDDPDATARLDITPYGFHGQILSYTLGAVYLEPAQPGDVAHYLSFFRADVNPRASLAAAPACLWQPGLDRGAPARAGGAAGAAQRTLLATGTNLRTYRLAVAATAEYTANRGGTVASAQAAIVTTVNRVTGVYERELAVRLLLVRNDGSLIYTNASTDPYTNNDPNSLVSQNQANVTTVVGTANFDIGHVFSTAGGGLAYVGVVCNAAYKAAGETGVSNPVGDAFDIDYVAHEMGHQFGGNHTFNSNLGSCGGNGNPSTAYEPGSGSTIMAYAGICSGDNLQPRSDPYFHVVSYEEIENYLATTSCGAVSSTGNSVPSVSLPPAGKTLPISTPFKLTASGTDANGDALTYCWEEWDLAQNGAPPLFRSFLPTASPTRYFPRLSNLLAGTTAIGETLPTTTRPLNFRVTVRDAHTGLQGVVGGINSSPVLGLSVSATAGPFVVTAPSTAVTWAAGSSQTVTWNVANTTAAPVSAATVNIRLSTDGGLTYPTVLATSTPNDGSESVTVPSLATTEARIMVEAADNYFFDISNASFTISGAVAGPALSSLSPTSGTAGTSVIITGTNLTGATAVSFNGTAAAFTVNSATQITATVPAGATTGNVTVTTPGGTSNGIAFTLTVPAPTLSALSPTTGTTGTTVVLTGTNLTGTSSVTFNGITATFTVNSATQITTSVPAGASTGNVVANTSGGASNGLSFTVTTPLPTLSTLSPTSGPAGTTVSITGTNLTGTTSVTFNGITATFTVNSATQLTTTVPAGATTGSVTVTTPAGTSNGLPFTVTIPAPAISSLSPTSGTVGTTVVITGTNLTGATAVSFNGTAATFTVNSATQITATVPAGASTGNVTVTTPGGTSNTAVFTVLPAAPALSSLSPLSGTVGTSVTITGTNLTAATGVSFNGTAATFTVNSATQITATVPAGATTGNVAVTTPGGPSNGLPFTITVPASTITSLSPTSGPVGTSVVITGTSFTGTTSVSFNGTVAIAFTVSSATQITATVPAGATTGSVLVTTPGGTSNGVAFTVIPPAPTLSSLSPTSGPVGTSVVITGTNLTAATGVSFNGTAATFTVNSATQITATVPAGATTGNVAVTTPGGLSNGLSFTIAAPAPSLSSLSPTSGPVGTSVVITGTSFTGTTSVSFNGTVAIAFTVNSATQITATVPAGATTGSVTVATPGGTSNGLLFLVLPPAPTLTNLSPSSGPIGTSVTIAGTNLTGTTSVSFSGSSASFVVNSATQITATVPVGATTGLVIATTPGGTSNGITFSVTAAVPVLSSLSPASGPAGTSVTITGTGLTGATAVSFNGTAATFTVVNAGTLTATVPAGATTGNVTVTTPGGLSNGLPFTITVPATTITALSPTSGPVGTSVIITGTNLTGATGLAFDGVSATFVVNSATQITTSVPGGATTGSVVVTTPAGPSNGVLFTVVPAAPTLTSISPNSSPVGTTVVLTGTNLTGTTAVSFNGTGATFTVNSATQITTLVPTGATSGPVTVATPGGLSNAIGFTVAVPTSTLTTLSPSSGGIGTTVVITGTNFTGAGSVTFNGVSATFTLNSSTQITTVVPFGATFGPVTVTVSGSSNGLIFTVIPPLPLIITFAPMGGPVGTLVTLTGTDFVGTTAVAFNGVSAPFTFVSGSALTATVPAGATTGPITVTTAGGTGSSVTSFTVLTPTLPSLTVSSPQIIPPGAYNNIDITSTGVGTLGGAVSVAGAFTVQAGGIFDDGCQLLTGAGSFTLAAGATLRTCSPGGISASGATGSVQVTGIRTFSPDASYVYNGTVAQLTGSGLPATVRNLTVNNATGLGLTQSLALTQVLTIEAGDLRLGASYLLLLSNASGTALVVNRGSGRVQQTGAGRATMQRFITLDPAQPYSGPGYRHYSPPVSNTTVADLAVPGLFAPLLNPAYNALPTPTLPPAQFPNVFDYQESRVTPTFPAFVVGFRSPISTSDALVPTAGYTVNIAPAATVDLSGLLNTGALNTGPLTRGATANSGWQFLGNPYPAPLDWAVVESTPGTLPPGLGAAIYVFEPTSQYGGFYRSYVSGVGTGGFVGVLPAMQGFFIRATQAVSGGFTFQDFFRVTTYQNPPFQRQTTGPDLRPRLRLTLAPSAGAASLLDETLVYFAPGATATGTDAAFDAPKLTNSNQLGLASRMPGLPANEAQAINGLPPALLASGVRIPLELELPAAGPYRLNAAELANFNPALPLALLDLANGTRTDLRLALTYAFTVASAGTLAGRFELLLGRTPTATTGRAPASAFSVWPNPVASGEGRLHIALATAAPAATAVLRTILGQPVRIRTLHNGTAELRTEGLATGTYLLTVQVPGEPAVTQRVLVE